MHKQRAEEILRPLHLDRQCLIYSMADVHSDYGSNQIILSGFGKEEALRASELFEAYESNEDYLNEALIPESMQKLLSDKYIEEHLADFIKDSQVCSFTNIVVEKESEALEIIEKSTDEKAFDQLMEDFGSDSEDAGVVTKNSALDDNLKDKLSDLSQVDKDGVYSQAIKLSDDNYAVVYLYDTAHKNTDGITSALASDG